MDSPVKILVCPLDWGIGHASRMIPVVYQLLQEGFDVSIATAGKSLDLMRTSFPEVELIHLPSVSIRYSQKKSQTAKLLFQVPGFLLGIIKEHQWLKKFLRTHPFDVVLSDNRYGLWNKKTVSIFVSHQLSPILPAGLKVFEPIVHFLFRRFIQSFDRCWIPDTADPELNLTGMLSHRVPFPQKRYF